MFKNGNILKFWIEIWVNFRNKTDTLTFLLKNAQDMRKSSYFMNEHIRIYDKICLEY